LNASSFSFFAFDDVAKVAIGDTYPAISTVMPCKYSERSMKLYLAC
jgi:hypothetical protein